MNDRFLHMDSYAKAHLVEQIMALIGRASSDPRSYRRTLESFETETLRRTLTELGMPESTKPGSCLPDFLINDFPALPEAPPVERIEAKSCGSKSATQGLCSRPPLILHSTLP